MDYFKAQPDVENERFLLTATGATVTEVKHEEHLEPPIFCAVKSEPQVRLSCIEYIIYVFTITIFVSDMFCFRMRMTLNRKGPIVR
jgi:hypothetical protein